MNTKKYFWSLKPKALKEVRIVLRNPQHPKFLERVFTLLSRCDNPKEAFSVINQRQFIEAWPKIRRYWAKINQSPDFKAWWETVYEQLLQEQKVQKAPKGTPSGIFSKIGKIFRGRRLRKGISQLDFARQVGMKQPDISAIESGRINITLETLSRLCKILNIKNLPFS